MKAADFSMNLSGLWFWWSGFEGKLMNQPGTMKHAGAVVEH